MQLVEKIKKKLWDFRKSKAGMTTIEVVIACIIFLYTACFAIDLIFISYKHNCMTSIAKELARTLSVQGGACEEAPEGYKTNYYYTKDELLAMVEDNFRSYGYSNDKLSITVEAGDKVYDFKNLDLTEIKIDYLETFKVNMSLGFSWDTFNLIAPGTLDGTLNVQVPGVSEWKYDYGNWSNEN